MARIQRSNLPRALFAHLLDRIKSISADRLGLLAEWLDTKPEVPEGEWFKKFSGMTVCGEGELIKTFLQRGQIAAGKGMDLSRRAGRKGQQAQRAVPMKGWDQTIEADRAPRP